MDTPDYRLYAASWSSNCAKAEDLLREAKVAYQKVSLESDRSLDAALRELSIEKLPALEENDKIHQGLREIKDFIEKSCI